MTSETQYEEAGGRLVRIVDRSGHAWAALDWRGDQLERLVVPGAVVEGTLRDDPLLGRVHGSAPVESSVALLAAALHAHAPETLERVWVVVREDDAAPAREAAARILP